MRVNYLVLIIGLVTLTFSQAYCQVSGRSQEIPLWSNGKMPGGIGPHGAEIVSGKGSYTNISRPRLIVHVPTHPNGTAVLVISGGGYAHIEIGNESSPAAAWLSSQGVTAFELIYRLPAEGWATTLAPFQDGQRALRLIRSMAEKFGIESDKIGVMGFSAGGHLAAMLETEPDRQFYTPVDDIDRYSAKCDFAALLYPIITMLPPYDHTHSEKELLGKYPDKQSREDLSAQLHVSKQTPPTFLAQAEDDPISNVANSKLMYAALQQNQIVSELHLFTTGGHGWGMGKPGTEETSWPSLFESWAKKVGMWK